MNTSRGILVILLSSLLCATAIQAQWVLTNGPLGGAVRCFAFSDTNLYAGTESAGISVTTDYGANWTPINTGLTNLSVRAFVISTNKTYIFSGTLGGGVFRSLNNGTGAAWTAFNTGLTNLSVYSLAANGASTFVGTGNGVFRASINSTSWTAVNSGLPNNLQVNSLVLIGSNIFAGTDNGVYRSSDNGSNWTAVNNGLSNLTVCSLVVIENNIFAGTLGGGVLVSVNNGESWFDVNGGLTNQNIRPLAVIENNIFAGTLGGGVFLSVNTATSWNAVNSGLNQNAHIYSLVVRDGFVFAGTNGNGVWRRPLSEMGIITSVQLIHNQIPSAFALEQNYPNPFNPTTTIQFALPKKSRVTLKLFDITGREVVTLIDSESPAGEFKVLLGAGNLPSGVYFYRLETRDFVSTRKLTLLK